MQNGYGKHDGRGRMDSGEATAGKGEWMVEHFSGVMTVVAKMVVV